MFNVNDYVVYKRDVCKITDIKKSHFNNEDYYVLAPISDKSLKIEIPVSNKFGSLRTLIDKKEITNIISKIPSIDVINADNKFVETEYKRLMSSGNHEDLIKIIKTAYARNRERLDNNKKLSDRDDSYFKLAEKFLYNEFSIVLNMNFEDTKKYVVSEVNKLNN